MSGKTSKKLWFSVIIIAVCIAVTVTVLVLTLPGGSDLGHIKTEDGKKDDGNGGFQIISGELDIILKRERLETRTVSQSTGNYVNSVDESLVDFSKPNGKNIFGLEKNVLIGPDSYFSAKMTIANSKPYAFEYWLEIIPEGGESLLADQLELTVFTENEQNTPFIQRTLGDKTDTKVFPKVESGQTATFTVKLEYLSMPENDLTQNTTLAFDMIVHARLTES